MNRDVDAAERWLESWAAGVDEQAERSARLARAIAALTSEARSRDGSIRVAVDSTGQLTALDLDDRVQRLPGGELAARIMQVMRTAQARLPARVTDEVRAIVGVDTPVGRQVIDGFETRFPPPPEEGTPERPER